MHSKLSVVCLLLFSLLSSSCVLFPPGVLNELNIEGVQLAPTARRNERVPIKVIVVFLASCRKLNDLAVVVDNEKRVINISGTEAVTGITCGQNAFKEEVLREFTPTQPGRYSIVIHSSYFKTQPASSSNLEIEVSD